MNKQNALKHLLFEHSHGERVSTRYGKTELARALVAWQVAELVCDGNQKKITKSVLDEIIVAVEAGDNVVDAFLVKED